jgi:hypothetical protein
MPRATLKAGSRHREERRDPRRDPRRDVRRSGTRRSGRRSKKAPARRSHRKPQRKSQRKSQRKKVRSRSMDKQQRRGRHDRSRSRSSTPWYKRAWRSSKEFVKRHKGKLTAAAAVAATAYAAHRHGGLENFGTYLQGDEGESLLAKTGRLANDGFYGAVNGASEAAGQAGSYARKQFTNARHAYYGHRNASLGAVDLSSLSEKVREQAYAAHRAGDQDGVNALLSKHAVTPVNRYSGYYGHKHNRRTPRQHNFVRAQSTNVHGPLMGGKRTSKKKKQQKKLAQGKKKKKQSRKKSSKKSRLAYDDFCRRFGCRHGQSPLTRLLALKQYHRQPKGDKRKLRAAIAAYRKIPLSQRPRIVQRRRS